MSLAVTRPPLPDFDDGPRRRAERSASGPSPTRREVLRTLVHASALVGLVALGLFRSPRRAGASPPPWTEITNRLNPNTGHACGSYQTPNVPCHTNMCAGTTPDLMDNGFCTAFCSQVNALNPYQWHKNRTYGNVQYRDGDSASCHPFSERSYDAWRWNAGNCGFCFPSNYRCHDGQKRVGGSATWAFTICEGLAACSGRPTSC